MQNLIDKLIAFLKANESLLSSVGNIVAILTAVIGIVGFILGWWRRLYQELRKMLEIRKARHTSAFPFEVISNPEQLKERLLPDPKQRVIPDRDIKYIQGRAGNLDTLFEIQGRILIKGRSKAGKTREMAELISRRWHVGLNILYLRPNAWLDAPFSVPGEMPYRNIVLVINDIDHFCAFDRPITTDQYPTSSTKHEPFPRRLQKAIEHFERLCGSAAEVRVVATIRSEPEFWDKIHFEPKSPPWNSFKVFELDDLPINIAIKLVDQLSQMSGITVIDDAKTEIVTRNDGTFLNIILAFRDWYQTGNTRIDSTQIKNFVGELANTWQRRYERAVATNPLNRYIYAAIDILRRINLEPHRYLVVELATRLEYRVPARLLRSFQTRGRRFFDKLEITFRRSNLAMRVSNRYPSIVDWFNRLAQSRLGKIIQSYFLYPAEGLESRGGSARIRKALQQLVETEIPIQGDILMPYDGQVDGRGDEWINSGLVSDLISEQASKDDHFIYMLISVADRLSDNNDHQGALRMLNRAVQIAPHFAFARQERARINRNLQQYDAALSDIDIWIRLDPSDYTPYTHKAGVFQDIKKYNEARDAIGQAISMSPSVAWLHALKADILADQGMFDEAREAFDKALSLDPVRHWTYGQKAIVCRKQGEYDVALKLLDKGIEIRPDEEWLWGHRGITLREMKRFEEALAAFDKAIKLDPKAAWLYVQKGITLREKRHYDEALEWIDRGIGIAQNYAWIYLERGITLKMMEQYEQALVAFGKAIELDTKADLVYFQKGITLRLIQRYDDALACFDKFIELNPNVGWGYAQQGTTLFSMKRYEEASDALGRAIELGANAEWVYFDRGIALRLMGQYDDAVTVFDKAIELEPTSGWVHAQKGITLRLMGRYEDALKAFDKAIDLGAKADWVYVQKGIILREMEAYDISLEWIDKGLEVDTSDSWNYYQKGITLRSMGRLDEALIAFDKALDLKSDGDWYLYNRAITCQTMGQTSRAQADLISAIQYALKVQENTPQDLTNNLDLALYHLASGEVEEAKRLYKEALSRPAVLRAIQEAIHDLEEFLKLFPDHSEARAMRELLSTYSQQDRPEPG